MMQPIPAINISCMEGKVSHDQSPDLLIKNTHHMISHLTTALHMISHLTTPLHMISHLTTDYNPAHDKSTAQNMIVTLTCTCIIVSLSWLK